MQSTSRQGMDRLMSAFFLAAGAVLVIAVLAITVRAWLAPPAHAWSAWSTGAVTALGVLAAMSLALGAILARRGHRERRDTVRSFLSADDRGRVAAAIRQFEALTSGEIRVHLAERSQRDPAEAAARAFRRLGMERTRDRNGVLFFVSIRDHRFAVIGDEGIHARVGADFWAAVVRAVEDAFARGRFADGLIEGIAMAGSRLAEHFPPRAGDTNELPDSITGDRD